MQETPVPEMTLRDFVSTPHVASARVAAVNNGEGAIYIVRTQAGAEHFFAIVACTPDLEGLHYYMTGPELMDKFGELRRVIPGYVMIGL